MTSRTGSTPPDHPGSTVDKHAIMRLVALLVSSLMIDLWVGGVYLVRVGTRGSPTLAESAGQLADPAAFGALVDLGGIQGSTPSTSLAPGARPGVTAKIAGVR